MREIWPYPNPFSDMEKIVIGFQERAYEIDALFQEIRLLNSDLYCFGVETEAVDEYLTKFDNYHAKAIMTLIESLYDVADYFRKFYKCIEEGDISGAQALTIGQAKETPFTPVDTEESY